MELMHGVNYQNIEPTGWWITQKFDGVRALWDGESLWSRGGKRWDAPAAWLACLPRFALDGELIVHGPDSLNATKRIVQARDADWTPVSFVAFDAPCVAGELEDRWNAMTAACVGSSVQCVEPRRCQGRSHLARVTREIISQGGEGVVLREASSLYIPGRHDVVQKVKAAQLVELDRQMGVAG